jgi:hypothetical protein
MPSPEAVCKKAYEDLLGIAPIETERAVFPVLEHGIAVLQQTLDGSSSPLNPEFMFGIKPLAATDSSQMAPAAPRPEA